MKLNFQADVRLIAVLAALAALIVLTYGSAAGQLPGGGGGAALLAVGLFLGRGHGDKNRHPDLRI